MTSSSLAETAETTKSTDATEAAKIAQVNARLATYACYLAFIALGACGTLLGPMYQSLTTRFNMPLSDAGIFTAIKAAAALFTVTTAGRLLDRINARYLLSAGVVLMGTGLFIIGSALTLPVAVIGLLLLGFGFGILDVSPNVVVAALNPERPSAALNTLNVFFCIGAIIGPQVVNFALSRENAVLAFYITGAFALVLAIPFLLVSILVHAEHDANGKPRAPINWFALLPFAIMLFTYVGAEAGFANWIFTQLRMVALSTVSTATIAASIFWAGMTIGRAVASPILRRLSDQQLLTLSIVIIGVGIAILLLFPRVENIALLCSFVVGFGCGPIFPIVLAIVNTTHPEARGTASGTVMVMGTFGGMLMPFLQGQIGGGFNGGMILPLILSVVMLGTAFYIGRTARTRPLAAA
jgi:fucose permease